MRTRRVTRNRWGGAVVEMAMVAPIFVFLIMAEIESARLGMVAQLLTTAARDGCRISVIDGRTNSDVTDQINADLVIAGIANVSAVQTPADCTTVRASDTPNTITLTLSVPYTQVSWLPTPYFLKTAIITASATMSSERP